MRALDEIKELIEVETRRADKLKTKKAKIKAWDKVRGLEREACTILYGAVKKYAPQSMKAVVKHFRPGDDHFLVETPYGSMWVSPTGDVLSKSWYPHTCCIEYTVGQEIVLEFHTEVNLDKLFLEIIPGKMYGGRVNETQYTELDKRDDLAFFKHSNSDGVTGLFKQIKAVSNE